MKNNNLLFGMRGFCAMWRSQDEKELEDALIEHVTRFLLELGAGFSYIGRQ